LLFIILIIKEPSPAVNPLIQNGFRSDALLGGIIIGLGTGFILGNRSFNVVLSPLFRLAFKLRQVLKHSMVKCSWSWVFLISTICFQRR